MSKIHIVCIEDEPDVLEAVVRELEPLEDCFPVEAAESAKEARSLLADLVKRGDEVGLLLCDHIMPGENGVDLLVDLQKDENWKPTRKVLLTGQAGLEATVKAVNQAELSHYIAKPWDGDELVQVAKDELTHYIKERNLNPMPYLRHLNMDILGDHLRKHLSADR
jgi:DNA-binding NtrC family response regulator